MVISAYILTFLVASLGIFIMKDHAARQVHPFDYALQTFERILKPEPFPKNDTVIIEKDRVTYNNTVAKVLSLNKFELKWKGESMNYFIPRKYDTDIHVILYHPTKFQDNSTTLLPVILWFHGGSFIFGSAKVDDTNAMMLSKHGFIVVNVDYRLSPEYMYPAALNDASDTLNWVYQNIHNYSGNKHKIIIAGESAGGTLAAALTSKNNNKIKLKGLLLIYPPLSYDTYYTSYVKYDAFSLSYIKMLWSWSLYVGEENMNLACHNYTVCPLRTPSHILINYPTTAIVLAKHDILVDEGLAFYHLLEKHYKKVYIQVYNDTSHGFFGLPNIMKSTREAKLFVKKQLLSMIQ